MEIKNKAVKIDFFNFKSTSMRTFHMTWLAFFFAFFAWFGISPLMAVVKTEFQLTKEQIGWITIASVAATVFVRVIIGWIAEKIGPRKSYSILLIAGAIPVIAIGFSQNFESFLIFRLLIGMIGASFVLTQYHTTLMFAPNVVGTANALTAGWGNLGGGVTQIVMPIIFTLFMGFGFSQAISWRLSMVVAGVAILPIGIAYLLFTKDTPDGNFKELRAQGKLPKAVKIKGSFLLAIKDYRVWVLFAIYAACFGIELSINNIAALYFMERFDISLMTAGIIASLFGLMNIFARALGGFFSDKFGKAEGLRGRIRFLMFALLGEGIALILFSQMGFLPFAIITLIIFSLFVQMSEGATYSVVPFVNKKALGPILGIVGAGGNVGAVMAGFLFKEETLSYANALFIIGFIVIGIALATPLVRFSREAEEEVRLEIENQLAFSQKLGLEGGH